MKQNGIEIRWDRVAKQDEYRAVYWSKGKRELSDWGCNPVTALDEYLQIREKNRLSGKFKIGKHSVSLEKMNEGDTLLLGITKDKLKGFSYRSVRFKKGGFVKCSKETLLGFLNIIMCNDKKQKKS